MKTLLMAVAFVAVLVGCAQRDSRGSASTSGGAVSGAGGALSMTDTRFVNEAAQAGLAEVRMGELAVQKAQSPSLRDYGQHLVTDHTRANEELARLAVEKGVALPTQMDGTDRRMIERLTELTGRDFDQRLQKDAVLAHERVIKQFEHASENCKDADLRAFAQKTLPVLREHLKMARQLSPTGTANPADNSMSPRSMINHL
jgi:putative membrane protein